MTKFIYSRIFHFLLITLVFATLILSVKLVTDRSRDYSKVRSISDLADSDNSKVEGVETTSIGDFKSEGELFLVSRVIDGDTVVLGSGETLRYVGIDTPEKEKECFSEEATLENEKLVEGKKVRLEKDVSEKDRYGRLLRYLWVKEEGQEIFVNDYLIREGYGRAVFYPPDVSYQSEFQQAEREAFEANKGLWGECNF